MHRPRIKALLIWVTLVCLLVEAPSASAGRFCEWILSRFNPAMRLETLLNSTRVQEAIWMLRDLGREAEAEQYTALATQSLQSDEQVPQSSVPAFEFDRPLLTLKNGLQGWYRNNGYNDVVGYELDRLLGLNIVPLTVWRKLGSQVYGIPTEVPGSFQVEVPGLTPDYFHFKKTQARNEVRFLKFLAGDMVHSSAEGTRRAGRGRRVAIGFSPALYKPEFQYAIEHYLPRRAVFEKLKSISDVDYREFWLKRLSEVFGPQELDFEFLADKLVILKHVLVEEILKYQDENRTIDVFATRADVKVSLR